MQKPIRMETLAKIAPGGDHSHPHHLRRYRGPGCAAPPRAKGWASSSWPPIRVDVVAHVLRCFQDDDITHVEGRIDPIGDAEVVETELMLADLKAQKRIKPLEKKANSARKKPRNSWP